MMFLRLLAFSASLAAASAQDARFGLELSLHAAGGKQVYRGQPAIVEARLVLEDGDQATVSLSDGAPWSQAVTLRLWSSGGAEVPVEWKALQPAGGPLAFTAEAIEATALFALDEAATSALPAGSYLLTASIDTRGRAADGTWAGTVAHRGLAFSAADEPAELPESGRLFKSRLRARWLTLNGSPGEALQELDSSLAQFPESIDLLSDKADTLEELDRRDEAVAALQQAIALFRKQNPKAGHPPRLLLQRLNRLNAY